MMKYEVTMPYLIIVKSYPQNTYDKNTILA